MSETAAPPPDFRALFEAAPGAYLVLDRRQAVVAASDAYLRAARARREDVVGRDVLAVFPAGGEALRASLRRVLAGGAEDALAAGRYGLGEPDGDGGERYWRPVNSPVAGADGEPAYVILRFDDVTDLIRLEQGAADSAARVESASDEAQNFVHLVAHDLQAPLNAISGCTRLLQEECEGKLSAQGATYMGYVLDYSRRAQTLIQDLLAYSRLESRAQPLEVTSLNKVFKEALDPLADQIAETGAEVGCGELPVLRVDRNQMILLLSNLIGNAIKFNTARPPRAQVAVERRGGEWLFSVRDNGIGIEPRFHDEIFEIFRRLHSAQAYPGSGIGLAMCQRIVARHGGRIWVESQAGTGSTFCFTLPAEGEA